MGQQHSAQMSLSSKLYPLITQRLEKILAQKAASKSARMAKLWKFSQSHPKPAFSVKVQTGNQKKFLKNRAKSSPRLKGPKALWRKWHYPLICTHLKCKHWRTFWRKQRLQKCPNGQVMAIFERSPKTRILSKSANEGPRRDALAEKAQNHSGANAIIL